MVLIASLIMNRILVITSVVCLFACAGTKPNKTESTDAHYSGQINTMDNQCDLEYVSTLAQTIDHLSQQQIQQFIEIRDVKCDQNIEFSEFYNEVLFSIAAAYPEIFCESLSKADKKKQILVIGDLATPVNDEINLAKLRDSFKSINCDSEMKQKILEAIDKAYQKLTER